MKVDTQAIIRAVQHVIDTAGDVRQVTGLDLTQVVAAHDLSVAPIEAFQRRLAAVVGSSAAVAVSSGTAALHLILRAIGIGPGDKVAVPAMAFVAAANAVRYCGAQPIFVDANRTHGGVSIESLSRHGTIKQVAAVIGIDLFGHPGAMSDLELFCGYHGVPLVEDACQALGSAEHGRMCGNFGMAAAFSFNVNKIVTTGGGGAVVTNSARLAERVSILATQAKDRGNLWGYDHGEVAFNYRMPPLCAALGVAQLDRLRPLLDARRALADRYREALADLEGIEFVDEPLGSVSNYWLPHLRLSPLVEKPTEVRDLILFSLFQAGVPGRAAFTPLCDIEAYRNGYDNRAQGARDLYRRTVCLPVRRGQ